MTSFEAGAPGLEDPGSSASQITHREIVEAMRENYEDEIRLGDRRFGWLLILAACEFWIIVAIGWSR